jgi:prepilin-type N-terminal cleavage/methylation domain-containing protein
MKQKFTHDGFTLIELLVVISIIGILIGLSIFGLQGAREASRDAKRKADLEEIRSGLELYKSDCNVYPLTGNVPSGSPLVGPTGSITGCLGNTYINLIPSDPVTGRTYIYYSADGLTYQLCASLEQGTGSVTCGATSTCGTGTCNYKVTNP